MKEWIHEWFNQRMNDIKLLDEWVNVCMYEWMNKWMNE